VLPPSLSSLKERLVNRGTETEKSLATRLGNSKEEITNIMDAKSVFCFRIVNIDVDAAAATFIKLIESMYADELDIC